MSEQFVVLTGIGRDRIGIVDEITAIIEELHCSIHESRMAVLGGEFAIIMLISGEEGSIEKLVAEEETIGDKVRLRIEVKQTGPSMLTGTGRPYVIETFSLDAPGIVHAVSAVLHTYNINIEDLETESSAAPWTGAEMFHMRAHIIVPFSVSIAELREDLSTLEHERDLDISLKPVSAVE